MTYRRIAGTPAAATSAAARAVGEAALAARLGVSASRVRQCANPERADALPWPRAIVADIACAAAGGGTPHFDHFAASLRAGGALGPSGPDRALLAAIRGAAATLERALALFGAEPAARAAPVARAA